jgi:hypothetical protein
MSLHASVRVHSSDLIDIMSLSLLLHISASLSLPRGNEVSASPFIVFVVPASACTYRLTARVFETLDFDKRGDWHDHAWRGGLFAKKG